MILVNYTVKHRNIKRKGWTSRTLHPSLFVWNDSNKSLTIKETRQAKRLIMRIEASPIRRIIIKL